MSSYQQLERLSETVAFGVLSQDVVIAADRMLSDEPIDDRERGALEKGRDLLRALAEPDTPPETSSAAHRLAENSRALATLDAAQARVSGEGVRSYMLKLADALEDVLATGTGADHRGDLDDITDLFSTIGQLELARANGLSTGLVDRPWRP